MVSEKEDPNLVFQRFTRDGGRRTSNMVNDANLSSEVRSDKMNSCHGDQRPEDPELRAVE